MAVYLQDDFNDTNGSGIGAHTMDVGGGWNVPFDWEIQGNRAALMEAAAGAIMFCNSGESDVEVSVDVVVPNVSFYSGGLFLRRSDNLNYWVATVQRDSGTPHLDLYEVNGGGGTLRDTTNAPAATGSTVRMTATLSGDDIVIELATGESVSFNSSSFNTGTEHGLWAYSADGYTPASFDDFLAQDIPAPFSSKPSHYYRQMRSL